MQNFLIPLAKFIKSEIFLNKSYFKSTFRFENINITKINLKILFPKKAIKIFLIKTVKILEKNCYVETIPCVIESQPWSKSSPNGDAEFVRRACFPSVASKV